MNLRDLTIGIIGGGVVGQATARSYLEHVKEVRVYDHDPDRKTHWFDETCKSDIVFICLPETVLETFFKESSYTLKPLNLVLKSTVPIGTTRRLREKYGLTNLVHSPEFLTARCAGVDAMMPARNVVGIPAWVGLPEIGDDDNPPPEFRDNVGGEAGLSLTLLYQSRWPHVPVMLLTSDESEAVKLFTNAFFAVKVAFWNELRAVADGRWLDWERVMNAVLADGRIHPSHTKVPGPDGKFGFGGACLPKDLLQLIEDAEHTPGCSVPLMRAAYHRNEADRGRVS